MSIAPLSPADVIAKLGQCGSAKFASFTHVAKSNGEIARHTVILHADYGKVLDASLAQAMEMLPTLAGVDALACQEVIDSLNNSISCRMLEIQNPDYTCKDVYVHPMGLDGVRVHKDTGEIYIDVLTQNKVVLQAGTERKPVKSSDKTIAKRKISSQLRQSKYRTFALNGIGAIKMDGETLIVEMA